MFGGRIPNYHKYADKMRPKEYIDRVRQREIYDPVLTFQLSNDFHVRKVMTNYLPNDEESKTLRLSLAMGQHLLSAAYARISGPQNNGPCRIGAVADA